VRQAIAHAVDSAAMIRGVFGGVPKQAAGFGPTEEGYDPTLKPFEYNPELSRRLLAEAGYPNGFRMPLVYFTNNYYGSRETAELVTLFLRRVGIQVDTRAVDSAHALSFNRENARDPNAVLVTLGTAVFANYSDPVEAMRFSYGTRPPNSYYRSKEFDKLIERAVLAHTAQERADALKACMRQFRKDVPLMRIRHARMV
jgi:peptide/nickel transport system substrate-binding protein